MEKQFNFPKSISVTQLQDVDGFAISTEICARYNAHMNLVDECNALRNEVEQETFFKNVYKWASFACMVLLAISLCF